MGLIGSWQKLYREAIKNDYRSQVALQDASAYASIVPLAKKYIHGKILDLGAGQLAWRDLLKQYASSYISADLLPEHPDLDLRCDVTQTLPFKAGSFDVIFCVSVLEHALEPWAALENMRRILTDDGVVLISVPFIFYMHGEPQDYWRFTHYGLRHLAEKAGFQVLDVFVNGGFAEFFLNLLSIFTSILLFKLHLQPLIPIATRFYLGLAQFVDHILGLQAAFAQYFIAVLKKSMENE